MSDLLATLTLGDLDVTANPVTVDHYVVGATEAAGAVLPDEVLPVGSTGPAVFASVPAGVWTFSARAVDASGATIGTPVTATYTLTAPVTVQVPVGVTVAQR